MNRKYRHKNYVTDVLSFESTEPNFRNRLKESLGEIVFCPDILIKQAEQNEHSIHREFDYLLIHGILHLLGYDHEKSKTEENKMFGIQDKLFSQLTDT